MVICTSCDTRLRDADKYVLMSDPFEKEWHLCKECYVAEEGRWEWD